MRSPVLAVAWLAVVCTIAHGESSAAQGGKDPPQTPAPGQSNSPKPSTGQGDADAAKPSAPTAGESPEAKAQRELVEEVIRAVNGQFDRQARGAVEDLLEAKDKLEELRSKPRGSTPPEMRKDRLADAEGDVKQAEALVKVLAKGDVNCSRFGFELDIVRVGGELRDIEKPLGSVNVEVIDISELAKSAVTVRCGEDEYRLVGWRVEGVQVGKRLAVSGVAFAHYSDEFKMTELVKASVFEKDKAYMKAREDRAAAFKAARKAIENTHRNASNAPLSR